MREGLRTCEAGAYSGGDSGKGCQGLRKPVNQSPKNGDKRKGRLDVRHASSQNQPQAQSTGRALCPIKNTTSVSDTHKPNGSQSR